MRGWLNRTKRGGAGLPVFLGCYSKPQARPRDGRMIKVIATTIKEGKKPHPVT
jgi:hypothetical protein